LKDRKVRKGPIWRLVPVVLSGDWVNGSVNRDLPVIQRLSFEHTHRQKKEPKASKIETAKETTPAPSPS
jgi:hypothetical protein